MEYKNEELINNIYSSYGPVIGKACENTNKFMTDNFMENINNSIKNIETNNILPDLSSNIILNNNIIGGEQIISTNIDDSSGYFNYKLHLFGYELSIWTVLLILTALTCVIYFIYKYFNRSNKDIITYQKNNDKLDNKLNDLSNKSEEDSSNESEESLSKSSKRSSKKSLNNDKISINFKK